LICLLAAGGRGQPPDNMSPSLHKVAGSAWLVCAWLLAAHAAGAAEPLPVPVPLYALLVGGGPDLDSNAAQIEGHVRFAGQILPPTAKRIVLFADGKPDGATVSSLDLSAVPAEKRALAVLLPDNGLEPLPLRRAPDLGMKINGPSRLRDLHRAFAWLSADAAAKPAPLLLYFAGHGTQNEDREADTAYDMWDGDELKVSDLAAELARLPLRPPVVLVMAQCFSGAFGDVLFRQGDPGGALVNRDVAGFFSARKDRVASGCSTETTAADYQDFSSYFFAALCGRDRFGHEIENADFDRDGRVSLHEAFCYALIHDASIDTPVCTSDVFLKRFAPLPDADIYGQPYAKIWQAATAAQRAVLDALSQKLGLAGEQRPLAVFDRLKFSDPIARAALVKSDSDASAALNALRLATLQSLFAHWPALRWSDSPGYAKAVASATDELARDKDLGRALLDADQTYQAAEDAVDNEEAALLRFAGVCESVVRAQHLRALGKEETRSQFERLWLAEQRSLPIPLR
jgi:hypothetical protein